MRPFLRVFASAIVLLAGVAQAGVQPYDRIKPGEGAVLILVSVDYPIYADFNINAEQWLTPVLTLERVGTSERYTLGHRAEGLQSSRAYAGSLPPGRYRVHDALGDNCRFWCGDGTWLPKVSDLGEFTIEPGQVRYLGSILASAQAPVPPNKKWLVWWAYTEKPEAGAGRRLLAGLYPELAAAAQGQLSVGWDAGDAAKVAAARDRIRRINSGLSDPSPHGKDGFFFGAQNGVIKRWSPGEGLRLIDTGSPFLLRGVVHGSGGLMLAGGEASTLLASNDDGASWTDVSAGLPFGLIMHVRPLGGDEVVFSMQVGDKASIYRGKLGEGNWTRLGEWPMEFATWTGVPGTQPVLQVQGHTLALTLPSKRGVFLDLDSGQTHEIALPGSLTAFSYTRDGVMRCVCLRLTINAWESRDLGKTWVDSPLGRFAEMPVFRDAQTGFSFRAPPFSAKKSGVLTSHDGGRNWSLSPSPVPNGWWLPNYSADGSVMLLSGITILYRDLVEQVYWSADEGVNWQQWEKEGDWLPNTSATGPAP